MYREIVNLNPGYLDTLLKGAPPTLFTAQLHRAYFSPGSTSYCILEENEPVFAGGIVNMQWNRGEAWMLPTRFFREHVKLCLKAMRKHLPLLAQDGKFQRVQATCVSGVSSKIFKHLGFHFEGVMLKFGPNGETC